jgi:ribosomal protein S18 acetylase RimI-like enzyme
MALIRRLTLDHADQAATIHCAAGALIPGYDMTLHSPEEYHGFYRDQVIPNDDCWGAFEGDKLQGFITLLPGWIDHLYVNPALHRTGIGSSLIRFAQTEQAELRLYTFQSNMNARAFYKKHGFVIEELTDGERNEEKMPDITYHWARV